MLTGMSVIELSAFVAVPLAGMTLAQLGAEVVRVDPVGGGVDYGRWPLNADGRSLYWAGLNKGKLSAAFDLRSVDGQRLVLDLIAEAGVLISNLRYPWLTYEAVRERRPDVIFVRLIGNPDGTLAVDYTVNAAAGFPMVTGVSDRPVNHVLPAWDLVAGHLISTAVLAAERHRTMTGEGQDISISLADVAFANTAHLGFVAEVEVNDEDRSPIGNHLFGSYGVDFATADRRRVEVVALTRRQWAALVDVTGTSNAVTELAAEVGADFTDEGQRFVHREALTRLFEPWFSAHNFAQVADRLETAGVLWGPYQTFRQLVETDVRIRENPMFSSVSHPGIVPTMTPASPISYPGRRAAQPAPALGTDTRNLLDCRLEISQGRIAELVAAGVIA